MQGGFLSLTTFIVRTATCCKCGLGSEAFDINTAHIITVPVRATLEEGLSHFFSAEKVPGYKCDRDCKSKVDAYRKPVIVEAPDFLVVQVSRYVASHTRIKALLLVAQIHAKILSLQES